MSSQALTSGDFVSRPNSAMAGRRHHRTSLMPPPRSRSSLGMHSIQPLTPSTVPLQQEQAVELEPEAGKSVDGASRTWSYDGLSGLKTYPILQLPDRETHDVYDPAWGLGDGGLAKHLNQNDIPVSGADVGEEVEGDGGKVQVGFPTKQSTSQTHGQGVKGYRKKLFYFDA